MADRDAIVRNAVNRRWRPVVEQAHAALFEVARTAGADLDGATTPQDVPDVAALALDAVRDLRADYDQAGQDIERAEATIARVREFAEQISQGRSRVVSRDFLTSMLIRLLDAPPATPKEHPDA